MNWLLILALVLFYAFLEGINAGTEERIMREAKEKSDAHRAGLYAGLLAACFNQKSLTDDEVIVDCKRRKQ